MQVRRDITAAIPCRAPLKVTRNTKLPTITSDVIAVRVDFGAGMLRGASNQARPAGVVGWVLELCQRLYAV